MPFKKKSRVSKMRFYVKDPPMRNKEIFLIATIVFLASWVLFSPDTFTSFAMWLFREIAVPLYQRFS